MLRIELAQLPALRLLFPIICGIYLANYYPFLDISNWIVTILCACFILILYLNYQYKKLGGSKIKRLVGYLIYGWILLFSYHQTLLTQQINNQNHFSKIKGEFITVMVDEQVQNKNGISRVKVRVKNVLDSTGIFPTKGNLLLAYKTAGIETLYYGDELIIPINYREITGPQNPYEFDYKTYLSHKNIYHQQFIQAIELKRISSDNGNAFIATTFAIRNTCIETYKSSIKNPDHAALISAFILGYRSDLSNETKGIFANTGTMHLLAVSGLHVGILFLLINLCLTFLDKTKTGRIYKAIIFVSLLSFYAMLTGLSPAVCRASLMLGLIVVSRAFSRAANSYNSIAVAAIIMLFINPLSIFEVGFQLSFIAVTGIIFFQPKIYALWISKWWIMDKIWALASTAIAAQLATTAISIYYFHQFPNYFLLANIPAVPLAGFILYSGLAVLLFSPFPFLANLLGALTSFLLGILELILKSVSNLPGVITTDLWISNWQFLILYVIMCCLTIAIMYKQKQFLFTSIFCLMLFLIGSSYQIIENSKRKAVMIAAIQGKTAITFIANKNAYLFLSDDITEQQISYSLKPTLSKFGIKRIIKINEADIFEDEILYKNKNIIQFMDKKYAIVSNSSVNFDKQLEVDYVILSQNPKVNLEILQKQFSFNELIVDNSNSNFLEQKFILESSTQGIYFYSTKQSKAFITLF